MKAIHLVCALLLIATAGAYAQGMSMPTRSAASAGSKAAMPLVNGEIRKLDPKAGLIVLRHGEIANLGMPPMTMGFDVADKSMLKGLKVGQEVKFQAEIVSGKATLTELHPMR